MTDKIVSLRIDPNLQMRLTALASKSGQSFSEFAKTILRTHADTQEQRIAEYAEDEQRWQKYIEGGQTLSLNEVRDKLSTLALQAAQKSAPQ